MSSPAEQKESDSTLLSEYTVYIVSKYLFCSELLRTVIQSQTAAQCVCLKCYGDMPAMDNNQSASTIFMWDCLGKGLDEFMNDFIASIEKAAQAGQVALFNVKPGLGIESNCVSQGVRGIFYEDDSLNLFLKGIAAIRKGELWFSREVMTKFILDEKNDEVIAMKVRKILTQREIEIISLLAVGCKNEEIADKLCVSPHTIKTHLYNIYKKINVTNRLQATLWAAKNL